MVMMNMKKFDAIIGYSAEKKELEQIADVMKNYVPYKKLGVTPPHGLLLRGGLGAGKNADGNRSRQSERPKSLYLP